jgi:membrane-bound lytic murein transglycosylase B
MKCNPATSLFYRKTIVRAFLFATGIILFSYGAYADSYDAWLADFRKEAESLGIRKVVLDSALQDVAPSEDIIALDRRQPEHTVTFQQYVTRTVTPRRIREGKTNMRRYSTVLKKIGKQYGVDPEFIVALWGMETNYGQYTGNYDLIESLTTLAYDGRRSAFFRKELINALFILQEEHMDASEFTGSWAGAMGQCQFMPTSYLKFAVDYNHDGRRDIWRTPEDVFASIANYLSSVGWHKHEGWGYRVRLPANVPLNWRDSKTTRTAKEWDRSGIRHASGGRLARTGDKLRLILPAGDSSVAYLVMPNYNTIMDWNRSLYFATSVGMLADAIRKE